MRIPKMTKKQIVKNIHTAADLLFEQGNIIVDGEWVNFSVEAVVLKLRKVRKQGKEGAIQKATKIKYVIHCYRDEYVMSGKRKVLATSIGSSPSSAFNILDARYTGPIVDRLRRQYKQLFEINPKTLKKTPLGV